MDVSKVQEALTRALPEPHLIKWDETDDLLSTTLPEFLTEVEKSEEAHKKELEDALSASAREIAALKRQVEKTQLSVVGEIQGFNEYKIFKVRLARAMDNLWDQIEYHDDGLLGLSTRGEAAVVALSDLIEFGVQNVYDN